MLRQGDLIKLQKSQENNKLLEFGRDDEYLFQNNLPINDNYIL